MGAAGRAQPTVNVAPTRNAVLLYCVDGFDYGAGGAPLALLLFFWLGCCLADLRRAPALYERSCSTRVDALEACVLGSAPTRRKPSAPTTQTPQCKAIDA